MCIFLNQLFIMKRILLTAISIATLLLLLFLCTGHSTPKDLDERAEEAFEYCKGNGYSTDYCLLVDYGRHSGRVRFFLWDFEKEKPALKCLCAHDMAKGVQQVSLYSAMSRGVSVHHWDIIGLERRRQ